MVKLNRQRHLSILLMDLIGAAACAGLMSVFVWFAYFRGDRTVAEIRELSGTIADARRDLVALRTSLDRQRTILQQRQAELAAGGQLPDETPIEEYFQTLSRVASAHRLHVVRHNPLAPRTYPGLLEQRYAYEVSGSMPDIARFLKAIEDARFWADVSYLKIDAGSRQVDPASIDRVASLTISVFSSLRNVGSDRDRPSPIPGGHTGG